MIRKIHLMIIIPLFFFSTTGCSSTKNELDKVINDYFYYKSSNDIENFVTTISQDLRKLDWSFDNISSINIINTKIEKNKKVRNSYLEYGRGNTLDISRKHMRVVEVKYEIIFKEENVHHQNGVYEELYFLIKKENQWLIDDIGILNNKSY